MSDSLGLPPADRSAPAENASLVAAQRRFGSLSGVFNATVTFWACVLVLAASLEMTPIQRYPLENTLRAATKRPLVLVDSKGQTFARRGECVASPVTIAELPRHFIDAVVAMEDRRFYSHVGVDPLGILRAAYRNYSAGGTREGGSTITQQLVKISYLSSARTMERKMEEALIATWLEMVLTKDQILERYLNSAYFGDGCFGVRAAVRHFFGKEVGEVSVPEAAFMVALLRSPTQLINRIDDANQRARLVMQAMVREGMLEESKLAEMAPVQLLERGEDESGSYYADWLTDSLAKELADPHSRQTLTVHTTFNPDLQKSAEKAVRSVLDKQGKRAKASQAALVAMRTDGRVVAMVGGREHATSQFNRAVQARRQPGSSFKMFVYLAALQAGVKPEMMVSDEPLDINGWEPKNFGGGYRGYVSLRQAFASSINTVAVKLSEAVGREAVIDTARNLGITSPLQPNPSIALGTSEVTLLEMTAAYAAVAAGAYPVKPWGVAGFDAAPADGGRPPEGSGEWKLARADDLRELLSGVVRRGSGRSAGVSAASYGKTGTSQDHRDAWFVGFAGNLVAGVWVGNDDFTPMRGVTGGSLPAQIWRTFMRDAIKTDPDFQRKLPRIVAFAARSKGGPLDRTSASIASLDNLSVIDRSPGHVSLSGSMPALRQYRRYSEESSPFAAQPEPRAAVRPSARASREFQDRLDSMGWPGGGD
jgi:penicillin-binding protein 1A